MSDHADAQTQGIIVSVIMPAYNEERYLAQSLDSVLNQSLKQTEIICIDDGSEDGTLEILEEYRERNEKIRVIRHAHGGQSRARNAGMEAAAGKYLLFLDSDDLLEEDALLKLVERAQRQDLDLLLYNMSPFWEDPSMDSTGESYRRFYQRSRDPEYEQVNTGLSLQEILIRNGDYQPSACAYLLKREMAASHGLSFYPGILHEDNLFTFKAMQAAERAGLYSEELYRRRLHPGSIMTTETNFNNAYGYLVCGNEMIRSAALRQGFGSFTDAQAEIIRRMQMHAAQIWSTLSDAQKEEALERVGDLSGFLYCGLENLAIRQSYAVKIEELHETLQKTYAEKSEINAKLQKTYAEKAERGIQIKELTKQLEKSQKRLSDIENSRSYKAVKKVTGMKDRIAGRSGGEGGASG